MLITKCGIAAKEGLAALRIGAGRVSQCAAATPLLMRNQSALAGNRHSCHQYRFREVPCYGKLPSTSRAVPKGKVGIITGSTSGIGLGIARALAQADIALSGFGDVTAIERERAEIAEEFGVQTIFNSADLAKPKKHRANIGAIGAQRTFRS